MILTITRGNVFEEYKLFHFEYAVLLEFLNDKFGGYMVVLNSNWSVCNEQC